MKKLLFSALLLSITSLFAFQSTWRTTFRNHTARTLTIARIIYSDSNTHYTPDRRVVSPQQETTFEAINTSSVENPITLYGLVFAGWGDCDGATMVTNRFLYGYRQLVQNSIEEDIIKGGPVKSHDIVSESLPPGGIVTISDKSGCTIKLGNRDIPPVPGQIQLSSPITPYGESA